MKVLQIIHGYPMLYNAGSEVYTQTLAQGLYKKGIDIEVFARQENPFIKDFEISEQFDSIDENNKIKLHLINVARQKDVYVTNEIDQKFEQIVNQFRPDIAHIQHLNHLSLTLIEVLAKLEIPIIFTLHDYWLACPRGQFLQVNYGYPNPFALCTGQEDKKCAQHCYNRFFTGIDTIEKTDNDYWTSWAGERQKLIRKLLPNISIFVAPSITVKNRMQKELQIPNEKIIYLDYGFDLDRLKGRKRDSSIEPFVFGYIGTHIVPKGIDLLIKSFSKLKEPAILRIFGRKRGETTPFLKNLAKSLDIPDFLKIEWLDEYNNFNIINDVFNNVDAIVVPSIWDENSPLVIHEALQARCLVITANHGGMGEYVKDKINGLTFIHRNIESLSTAMKYAIDNRSECKYYSDRGYLLSQSGNVVDIDTHTEEIIKLYKSILNKKIEELEI